MTLSLIHIYFLSIDGHIYTVQVYADGKMPQDAVDYFDGLLLEACHTVVDLDVYKRQE